MAADSGSAAGDTSGTRGASGKEPSVRSSQTRRNLPRPGTGTTDPQDTETIRLQITEFRQYADAGDSPDQHKDDTPLDEEVYTAQFHELFESVYDAALITNLNGQITKANTRALSFFQYTLGQIYGLSVLDILTGADANLLQTIYQTLHNQRRVFIEGYCQRKDRSLFPAEITVNSLHMKSEEKLCFFIRNIAVRKRTEEALQKAQAELVQSAHLAGMAEIATGTLHDVGNILNSITVSNELLMSGLQSHAVGALAKTSELLRRKGPQAAEFIAAEGPGRKVPELVIRLADAIVREHEQLRAEAENLRQKVSTVRDVISTQQAYAKAGLFQEVIDLNAVVDDAMAILQASMSRGAMRVDRQFCEKPALKANKSKLIHVVLNLIQNARDALASVPEKQRLLTLVTRKSDSEVLLEVVDTGEGIAPGDLKRIFNHGFTTKPSGHGFGLHTSANFVREMGGNIEAHSDGPGQGATFTVRLPTGDIRT